MREGKRKPGNKSGKSQRKKKWKIKRETIQ